MSICITDLYEKDLVIKLCGCGIISFKSNFFAHKLTKDILHSSYKVCVNQKQKDFYSRFEIEEIAIRKHIINKTELRHTQIREGEDNLILFTV